MTTVKAMPRDDGDFLTRIQLALDMTPTELASALDIPYQDVVDRHGTAGEQSELFADPFWTDLSHYIDMRIGMLMGAREELNRKLRLDIDRRNAERRKTLER